MIYVTVSIFSVSTSAWSSLWDLRSVKKSNFENADWNHWYTIRETTTSYCMVHLVKGDYNQVSWKTNRTVTNKEV